MNYLKHITNTFLKLTAISAIALLFGVSYAYAQASPLVVDFETDPLFSETDILPGGGVIKTVTVANNSENSQNIIVEAINAADDDGLGGALHLIISEDSNELYSDTLGDFLREGEIPLSAIPNGGVIIYSFSVSFDEDADNSTQKGEISFDLCVGFEGGISQCGDTEIGGEGETGDKGSEGNTGGGGTIFGSSSSSGGSPAVLEIKNEQTTDAGIDNNIPPKGTATIEWNTNLLSTSQVIYGIASAGPYSFNLTVLPYFGYPMGTIEDETKTTKHIVVLTGLEPNEVYKYRVVSRSSPPTISYEHTFVVKNDFTEEGSGEVAVLGIELEPEPEIGKKGIAKVILDKAVKVLSLEFRPEQVEPEQEQVEAEQADLTPVKNKITEPAGEQTAQEQPSESNIRGIITFLILLFVLIILFWLRRIKKKRAADEKQ